MLAAGGLFYLIPRDLHHIAVELVGRLHLNAGKSYPDVFSRILEDTSNAQLWLIGALVLVYAGVRFAEAYGLWLERRWAEWLTVIVTSSFIPFEIYELARRPGPGKVVALALNGAIAAYLAARRVRAHADAPRVSHFRAA